jgi:hypothetical protein
MSENNAANDVLDDIVAPALPGEVAPSTRETLNEPARPALSQPINSGEPYFVSATVRFQTLNDNKDRNSVVTVTVRDATNAIIAFVDNIFDEFKDRRLCW